MGMSYGHAHHVKNRSALSLIVKKFAEGQGLGSAISNTLSEKSAAKMALMKERLDPMSWSRKLGGKFGAALYGRAMGRSAADMRYFTGYSPKRSRYKIPTSKDKNPNINPLYTKISSTSVTPVRKNDSVSDILAKLYNYMKINHEKDIKRRELKHNFKEGLDDKVNKQHKDLVKVLKDSVGKSDKNTTPNNSENLWAGIIDKIFDLGKFVLGGALGGLLGGLLGGALKRTKTITEKMGGEKPKETSKSGKEKSKSGTPKPGKEKSKSGTPKPGKETSKNTDKKPFEKFKPKSKTTPEKIKERATASKEAKTAAYNKEYPTNGKGGITSKPTAVKVLNPTAAILKGTKAVGEFAMNQLGFKSILSKAIKIPAIMSAWDQIQKLDKTKFNTTNKYNAEITKIIMKVVSQYGVAVVLMGLGGTLFNFMFPGVGAVAGAIVGFILGAALVTVADKIFTDSELEKSLNNLISRIANWFWGSEDIKKYNLDSANYIKENIKGPNGESYVPANDTDVAMSPGTKFGDAGYHDKNSGQFKKFTDVQMAEQLENFTKQNSEGVASTIVETVRPYADKVGNTVDSTIDSGVNYAKDKLIEKGWIGGKPTEDIIKESVVDSLSSVVKAAHNAPRLITIEKGSALANAIDEYTKLEMGSDGSYKNNAASNMVVNKNSVNSSETPPTLPMGDVRNKPLYKYIPYQAQ